ncbi:putative Guanylate kinase 50S ribosome binding GTPase [Trypanosoma vivax]|nr:guanylate kinase [Trypanosoma vivax]KAH8611489.1 putative Guanylate kinase 50S ribosome binding GTPase [Trypanosoma vivax]
MLQESTVSRRGPDIIVFVGPSGCGKSTLIQYLLREWPQHFEFSVSYTTRKPRRGEVDGVHYHFVTREKFLKMLSDDAFVEHSKLFSFENDKRHTGASGNNEILSDEVQGEDDDNVVYYGTSRASLYEAASRNRVVLMDTDINGAKNIRRRCEDAGAILNGPRPTVGQKTLYRNLKVHVLFVMCSKLGEVNRRLRQRGTETEAALRRRFLSNQECLAWYAARPRFFDFTIRNDDLEACFKVLRSHIMSLVPHMASKL